MHIYASKQKSINSFLVWVPVWMHRGPKFSSIFHYKDLYIFLNKYFTLLGSGLTRPIGITTSGALQDFGKKKVERPCFPWNSHRSAEASCQCEDLHWVKTYPTERSAFLSISTAAIPANSVQVGNIPLPWSWKLNEMKAFPNPQRRRNCILNQMLFHNPCI